MTVDLPRPFKLEGITRIDETPVAEAIREALLNTLVNADYYGTRGLVIIKSQEGYSFANPGCLRISQKEALSGGVSDPRNAAIFSMFSLVDLGERAGTGIPSIYYAWEEAFDLKPTLVDKHNPDRTEMFVPRITATITDKSAVKDVLPSVKHNESAVNYRSPSVKECSRTENHRSPSVNETPRTENYRSPSVNENSRTAKRPTKEDRKNQIVELLSKHKELEPTIIGQELGINATTLRHYIPELVAEGKIGFTGTFRNRTYHIIEK